MLCISGVPIEYTLAYEVTYSELKVSHDTFPEIPPKLNFPPESEFQLQLLPSNLETPFREILSSTCNWRRIGKFGRFQNGRKALELPLRIPAN